MILLDTNICIAALKHDRRVLSRLVQRAGSIYLPFVVSGELYFGIEKRARAGQSVSAARQLVDEFHRRVDGVLGVTTDVIQHYARLRGDLETAGQPIGANDTWIAALALAEDALLISANRSEFQRVPNLKLDNWLERVA